MTQREPVDPDVDLHVPGQRAEWSRHRLVLPLIAAGGVLGALARHGLELLWPAAPGDWPWPTFVANVSGSLLIGALMVYVAEAGRSHPLLRPFLGAGVLGGFTTFSAYAAQAHAQLRLGEGLLALGYLLGTLAAAMLAVAAGVVGARATVHAVGSRPSARAPR